MNLRTAGLALATAITPLTAKTPKTMKSAVATAPVVEQAMHSAQQTGYRKKGQINVGMRYGKFKEAVNNAKKRPSTITTGTRQVYSDDTYWNYYMTYDKNGNVITAGTYTYNPKTNATTGFFSDSENDLNYSGKTFHDTFNNIRFSRIMSPTHVAVDKNGNGIVDKGEIYLRSNPPGGEVTAANDERRYGLDLSVGFFE